MCTPLPRYHPNFLRIFIQFETRPLRNSRCWSSVAMLPRFVASDRSHL